MCSADVRRYEAADELIGVDDLNGESAIGVYLKIAFVVMVVVDLWASGAEFDVANLAKIHERYALFG